MSQRSIRLLVTGASGVGSTSLGRALADKFAVPHSDTDDYFWLPTNPPYRDPRPVTERLSLMESIFLPRDSWILSGSLMGWGEPIMPKVRGMVFLTLSASERLARLEAREVSRYGSAIAPGGPLEQSHREFIEWAGNYDDPDFGGRNRDAHERWLASFALPVLRLETGAPVAELAAAVADWLDSPNFTG